ncbi:MAG: hypothetical protein SFX74_09895 [Fimbriimonadaceae bacterium]|nr:hypothetical protein [Fimbriimonadaceae bacterium]
MKTNASRAAAFMLSLTLLACGGSSDQSFIPNPPDPEPEPEPLSLEGIPVPTGPLDGTTSTYKPAVEIRAIATSTGTDFPVGPLNAEQLSVTRLPNLENAILGDESRIHLGFVFRTSEPSVTRHFYLIWKSFSFYPVGPIQRDRTVAGYYLYQGNDSRSKTPIRGFGHRVWSSNQGRFGRDEILMEVHSVQVTPVPLRGPLIILRFDMRLTPTYDDQGTVRIRGCIRFHQGSLELLDGSV